MTLSARIITPKGEIIHLQPATYRQIQKLIITRRQRRVTAKFIQSTYGKYAGKTSLTQALLFERAAEFAREETKIKRLHVGK